MHGFLPNEFEELDAITQNARKKLEIPVEPAVPCVKQTRIQTAKAPTQKVCSVKRCRGGGQRAGNFTKIARVEYGQAKK